MQSSQGQPTEVSDGQTIGKPPEITRKITACVACRKQKIRCHMSGAGPPCTRCKKRGLSCTVNRSLQTILESEGVWKASVERKISKLESALSRVSTDLHIPDLLMSEDESDRSEPQQGARVGLQSWTDSTQDTPRSFEIVMDPDSGPAAIPGSVVLPIDSSRHSTHTNGDIVSRGIITLAEAQSFLDVYQDRLDHFLYRILGDRRHLQQIRSASQLLLTAISAVGALHMNSPKSEELHGEFVAMAASVSFLRQCRPDDIQALCIGAFWLSGISWMCVGAAVRLCSELQLHRSIFKALQGDRVHYLRTRLYYLVYVCDHQFSVAYGRPPMTREDDAVLSSSRFLQLELATQDDARLISQVQFWTVGSEIYQAFGIDVELPLTGATIGVLRRLSIRLDKVRADWNEAFTINEYVGNYPKKGVGLHYHFARLYLYSMAFRGIGKAGFKVAEISLDIEELAHTAVLSATTILRTVASDTEIQVCLNGLPTYFDVMIAFAVVFLLKVSTRYAHIVRVDSGEIRDLVNNLAGVLQTVTVTMHPRHLLVSVAKGTRDLLERSCHTEPQQPTIASAASSFPDQSAESAAEHLLGDWPDIPWDDFMGEFDFLAN